MLVYLDSAHLALLERANSDQREAFFTTWLDAGCDLALSVHHLQEIAQLSDRTSVERRLDVLAAFPRIRCRPADLDLVQRLEIQLQLQALIGFRADARESALATLFPVATLDEIRVATVSQQSQFKLMRDALQTGADAANIAKEPARASPSRNLNRPIDPARLDSPEMRELFEAAIADVPPEAQSLTRTLFEQVKSTILAHGSVRHGLERALDLSDFEHCAQIADADLPAAARFFSRAREELSSVLASVSVESTGGENLVRRLNPYAAPGFALQAAVDRARKRHPKPDIPGDQIDVAHLGFAPYVDLLFVDKRTFGFITQEARDDPQRLAAALLHGIVRAGTLETAAEIIRVHAGMATANMGNRRETR